MFIELLSVISRQTVELNEGDISRKYGDVQMILDTIQSKYRERWSVKSFADMCNLSICRFIHKFKTFTGMYPMEYLPMTPSGYKKYPI